MWARRRSGVVGLLAVLLVPAAVAAQPVLELPRERIFSFDMVVDPQSLPVAATSGPAGVAWSTVVRSRFPQGGTFDGIRVRVVFAAPVTEGRLRVLDGAGADVESVVASAAVPVREFWSRDIPGGVARVEFSRTSAGSTPAAVVSYAYHVTPSEKQSISGPNQLMKVGDAPARIRRLGRPIARLRFMVGDQGQATCTAFLVGRRLLLTNQHCIATDDERASALVDFFYDADDSVATGQRVAAIVASDRGLDYTLLQLTGDPPAGAGRLFFAPLSWAWPADAHPLVIVQHPSGLPKRASIADCSTAGDARVGVLPGEPTDFGHRCDTLGGSSGSPVLDWSSGVVVGLHHFGFVSGSPDPVNQAVSHARILRDIRARDAVAFAEVAAPPPPD